MTQTEYEQKKRECCEEFVRTADKILTPRDAFLFTFDRAYALGKQEKNAEEQEVFTCEKSNVLYRFRVAEACKIGNNPESDYWIGYSKAIQDLFGLEGEPYVTPNDAEGEDDEMLCVSRKKLQYFYEKLRKVGENHAAFALQSLFGSKCLPDNVDSLEPKPAEPKFKVDDKVECLHNHHIYVIRHLDFYDGIWRYNYGNPAIWIKESDLVPYTEPEESNCTIKSDSSESETDRHHIEEKRDMPKRALCDKLIQRGFRNHNRLHIAAMLAAGMLANDCNIYPIDRALELADALIAESEKKGGEQ